MKFSEQVRNILSSKGISIFVTCIALILTLTSLKTGLQFDDYIHQAKFQHPFLFPELKSPVTDLFTFATGNPEQTERLLRVGVVPWWTTPDLLVSFFRPLTVATHWLDYKVWPNMPVLMHAQSMLWFGAMVFMAAVVYRRMITPLWAAGLAALLFSIDYAHGMPVGWLANRNVLIAALFGFLTIYLHDRWRRLLKGMPSLNFGLWACCWHCCP